MSFETLVLIVIFLVMPLLERLVKVLRERGAAGSDRPASTAPQPMPLPMPPRPTPARAPAPPRRKPVARAPDPRSAGVPSLEEQSLEAPRGPRRRPAVTPPERRPRVPRARPVSEAASLETAALALPEAGATPPARPADAPAVTADASRRGPRHRIDLRRPDSLRDAIVAQAVLGPCRAMRPHEFGRDL